MKARILALPLALISLASGAQADADAALAAMKLALEIGIVGSGDVPATRIEATGCQLLVTTEDENSRIGTSIALVTTADARLLTPDTAEIEASHIRDGLIVPGSGDYTMNVSTSNQDPAVRAAFAAAMQTTCPATGPCAATHPAPGFLVAFYGDDRPARIDGFRAALADFAQTCTDAE